MPDSPTNTDGQDLPEELLQIVPGAEPPLRSILKTLGLLEAFPPGHRYRRVWKVWQNSIEDSAWRKQGSLSVIPSHALPRTDDYLYAHLWGFGDPVRQFKALTYGRAITCHRLAVNGIRSLRKHDITSSMMMFRGTIELIASYSAICHALSFIKAADHNDFDESYRSITRASKDLTRALAATKVDWRQLTGTPQDQIDALFKQKKLGESLKYAPRENRFDLEARSVLSSIDRLNKSVPGSRVAYEILCEFTHPNFGVHLGLNLCQEPVQQPNTGTPMLEVTLSTGPPCQFYRECAGLLTRIFQQLSESVDHFWHQATQGTEIIRGLQQSAQTVNRRILTDNPQFKHPYIDCPCDSGKKIRFCCGSPKDK